MHQGHKGALLDADAMFTAQATTFADGHFYHFATSMMYALHQSPVLVIRYQNEWMQVAITGVKDIAHTQVIAVTDGIDLAQRLHQTTTRNGNIYSIVGGSQARDCSGGTLA